MPSTVKNPAFKSRWYSAFLFVLGALLTGVAFSQPTPVKILAKWDSKEESKVVVSVSVGEGWHIQANKPSDEYAIPTELKVSGANILGDVVWPAPEKIKVAILGGEQELLSGNFDLSVPIELQKSTTELSVTLSYQACNDTLCLPPADVSTSLLLGKVASTNNSVIATDVSTPSTETIDPAATENRLSGPWFWVLLFLLGGGLLLNLTPCVYPLLAITISLFGSKTGPMRSRFLLSLAFVVGMVLTFSILGLTAAFSGKLFGSALQSPWVQAGIGLVFFVLALSSMGLFELQLPSSWLSGAAKAGQGRRDFFGIFLAGLFSGVLASPCIGPFVLGLILYVGEQRNLWQGFWMFTVLGFGMGIPYIILGTFTGLLGKLPKSGGWMVDVKKILALVLLGLCNYYLRGFYSSTIYQIILAVLLIYAALYINPFAPMVGTSRGLAALLRTVALVVLLLGVYTMHKTMQETGLLGSVPAKIEVMGTTSNASSNVQGQSTGLNWKTFEANQVSQSLENGNIVVIDFESKIWCAACREMEEKTYNQLSVISALQNGYDLYKVDVDHHPKFDSLQEHFAVVGIPTLIVLGSEEKELTRIVGFVGSEEFLKRLPKNNSL